LDRLPSVMHNGPSMRIAILFVCSALLHRMLPAQGIPTALRPDISVEYYMDVRSNVTRLAFDPVTQRLCYLRINGDVYAVIDNGTDPPFDTLLHTAADHLLTEAFGIAFHDSDLFVIGNRIDQTTQRAEGILHRARLLADGQREWSVAARTELYHWGGKGHGFNHVVVSPDGQYLLLNSGSRTDHGEVQDVGGLFPGLREDPITAKILRVPIDANEVVLMNDETTLTNAMQLFASGVRNTYDMAFNAAGDLFGVDNSGDHDDPEEMNWLQEGGHYGFPWAAGGNTNPTVLPGYDPVLDPLLNPGYPAAATDFYYDADFPAAPPVTLTDPLLNIGPDADRLRDPLTAGMMDASDSGAPIRSFTCHRSPLGLVFDRDSILSGDLRGDGFVLSFTPGGDTTGYSVIAPWGIPVVPADPSEDLLHLELNYDEDVNDYIFSATRIAAGFYLPVDAELVGNVLYVVENWGGIQRSIWKVTMPLFSGVSDLDEKDRDVLRVWPVPAQDAIYWSTLGSEPEQVEIIDLDGRVVNTTRTQQSANGLSVAGLPAGVYALRVTGTMRRNVSRFVVAR
jgi:hypothetical protein